MLNLVSRPIDLSNRAHRFPSMVVTALLLVATAEGDMLFVALPIE